MHNRPEVLRRWVPRTLAVLVFLLAAAGTAAFTYALAAGLPDPRIAGVDKAGYVTGFVVSWAAMVCMNFVLVSLFPAKKAGRGEIPDGGCSGEDRDQGGAVEAREADPGRGW